MKVKKSAIREFLKSDGVADEIGRIADEQGNALAAAVGAVNGYPITVRRETDETPDRHREAILLLHPTPSGRLAGHQAGQALFGGNGVD